ncbi:MAG: fimbrillin family protein [Prevotella sp.]|nr:fimbrillin family protein [Prevotella sp.]
MKAFINNYVISACMMCCAIGAASCSGDEKADIPQGVPGPITIVPIIAGSTTRTATEGTNTSFVVGDQLTVYAWKGYKYHVEEMVVDGVTNTLDSDSVWTSSPQMLWGDMVSNHYFMGIYPAHKITDLSADEITLKGDYDADDLLSGFNIKGLKATDMATVGIVFDHLLARLNVNLTFKSQWETTPEDVTATYTAVADAIVNYWEGTSLPNGTAKVLPLSDATTAPGFQYSLHGIIIPQTGFRVITVNVEGKNYTYTHPGDIPLGKGMITTVNLIIGRQTIELGTLSIDRWSDGGSFDGTGQRQ